jgi:hypothetical protein
VKSHYQRIARFVEQAADALIRTQCLDPASRDYGGQVLPDRGYADPVQSAYAIDTLASVYCCPVSSRHGERLLVERALLYAGHLLREQHEDGTIDLKSTNFHDATAVAFSVQVLAYTVRLLRDSAPGTHPKEEGSLAAMIESFLRHGGEGMLSGGFHTPNHRWVMASALSLLYRLLADERFLREAELYLAEGIDCTEEGEYTERSVGIYNVVNNRSLAIMAEELGRPGLLDHVKRNLDMVERYIEPDGSLYTLNSRRQDLGLTSYATAYYENYLLLAHATGNPEYAGMAGSLLDHAEHGQGTDDRIDRVLTQYLLRSDLRERDIPSSPPPVRYELWNPSSGIARFRTDGVSLSLLAGAGTFLKLQVGELSVIVRLAATFFGSRGRFSAQILEREGAWIVLRSRDRWGYVRPFRDPPPTSEWKAMPHESREHVNMQDHEIEARARFTGDGVTLRLLSSGVAGVLYKVELLLAAGGWLETPDLKLPGGAGRWALLGGARATYTRGFDRIEILGGFAEHAFTTSMRGSEPQDPNAFTLYCTGYTPMDREIIIRAERTPGA